LSNYPTCQFVTNTDVLMESILDGQDKPLPEEIRCGRCAFFCFNSYHRHHTEAVRLLLPILDPEHAKEYGWEHEHSREEWLAQFRKKVGDDADHWYFLCPRHWLYHKWLRITIGIEDYISYYIWRGFCWHAPWDRLWRLFIRNSKGNQ
jgi:hypothetical protein